MIFQGLCVVGATFFFKLSGGNTLSDPHKALLFDKPGGCIAQTTAIVAAEETQHFSLDYAVGDWFRLAFEPSDACVEESFFSAASMG